MDNFRWILLAAGVLIVLIIYLISRRNSQDDYIDIDLPDDLPDVRPHNWDDLDEGVGEVRIVARQNDDELDDIEPLPVPPEDDQDNAVDAYADESELQTENIAEPQSKEGDDLRDTVVVLNILARDGGALHGKSINSVAHANDMVFGDMNIYHRLDSHNKAVFSMVNMVEPGSFDPSTIHEMTTPGVSLFMQLPGVDHPRDSFDDMLQTAYRMSETLGARLCGKSRQPLTDAEAEQYRKTVAAFDARG